MGVFIKEKKEDIFSLTAVQEHMNDVFLNEGEAGAEYIIRYIEEARLTLAKDILKEMMILKESVLTEGAATQNFVKAVKVLIDKFVSVVMNAWNKILAFYYKSATAIKTRFGGLEKYFEINKAYILAGIDQAKPIGTYNVLDLDAPILNAELSVEGIGKALYGYDDVLEDIITALSPRSAVSKLYTKTGIDSGKNIYFIHEILEKLNISDTEIKKVINKSMFSKFITIDEVADVRGILESEFKKSKMLANVTTSGHLVKNMVELNNICTHIKDDNIRGIREININMNSVKNMTDIFKEKLDEESNRDAEDTEALLQATKIFVNKLSTIRSAVLQNTATYVSAYNKYVSEDVSTWSTILTKLCAIGKQVEKNG